jgi:hypothetical protein
MSGQMSSLNLADSCRMEPSTTNPVVPDRGDRRFSLSLVLRRGHRCLLNFGDDRSRQETQQGALLITLENL